MNPPPLDQSVVELLRGSALAPMIDRPVNDILKDIGLGPLPQLPSLPPLPELPPLPVIDLSALFRPLTDMASGFGTGAIGGGPGPDPTQVLQSVTSALTTAMSLGTTALSAVMQLWQSAAAMQAAEKATAAQQNGAELAAQGTEEKAVLGTAATSVATGGAEMTQVISKFVSTVAATAPFLALPGGQAFLAAATAEAIAEGVAVVTKTRAEMTVHSASMTQAGEKVKVTNAPKGADSMQELAQLMQLITPLMTLASTGVQAANQLASANTSLLAAKSVTPVAQTGADGEATADGEPAPAAGGVGGGGGGGGIGGIGLGGIGTTATPLNPWSGTRSASVGGPSSGQGFSSAPESASAVRAGTVGGAGSPGYMPMGGAAGAAAGPRGAGDAGGDLPGFLVNAQHGDEVVGNLEGASLPVVGAAEQVSEPPPDRELTL
ncbi:hypothetical protein [Nocardia bovistercoris]|uniref:Uncharacterized protein n=1 Tax=Nocardia bovistercoris TaxID=2785916 RepID=A0A931IBL6_9NOCA|nr:hypothetical protein [Nocardia bovistercoris]MBH0777586.1 hypothetical protein [Nocardia bovistercoris]